MNEETSRHVPAQVFNIDFDRIREIAHKGARRAAVFLGLGLNTAYDENYRSYELTNITQIQLIRSGASHQEVTKFKEEFALWIIGGGLREMVESFAIFLDELHEACWVIAKSGSKVGRADLVMTAKKFHWKKFPDKIDYLEKTYGVESNSSQSLITVNQARNCLVHRRGIVERADCAKDDSLLVKWRGIDLFIETPSGERIQLIPSVTREEIYLEEGGRVKYRMTERIRSFTIGERVILSATDLAEICNFIAECANDLCRSAIKFAEGKGIPKG
jgi:hypothetical protein